jgi:hypothetical protein
MQHDPYPNRLTLRGEIALNMGFVAESRVFPGYTVEEMRSRKNALVEEEDELGNWKPQNPRSVALRLILQIGWDDDPGPDDFTVYCITNDLRDAFKINSRATIYCEEFEWPKIKESILNILKKCERATWDESVKQLRKRFDWEYEGYAGT